MNTAYASRENSLAAKVSDTSQEQDWKVNLTSSKTSKVRLVLYNTVWAGADLDLGKEEKAFLFANLNEN